MHPQYGEWRNVADYRIWHARTIFNMTTLATLFNMRFTMHIQSIGVTILN